MFRKEGVPKETHATRRTESATRGGYEHVSPVLERGREVNVSFFNNAQPSTSEHSVWAQPLWQWGKSPGVGDILPNVISTLVFLAGGAWALGWTFTSFAHFATEQFGDLGILATGFVVLFVALVVFKLSLNGLKKHADLTRDIH